MPISDISSKLLRLAAICAVAFAVPATAQRTRDSNVPAAVTPVRGPLPPPADSDLRTSARPYRIGPFDRLVIDVFGIPDFREREVQTDASGRINYPLIGSVDAAGRTPNELAAVIADRLRGAFIRNPQVTVNLRETSSQTVTVEGEVREPGIYPVVGEMTLLRAIATAKGTTENARRRNVLIFRTVNGQKLAGVYDLKAIRQGQYDDPDVYPNDVVVISDNAARRLLRDILGIVPAVTTPLILLLRN